MDGIVYLLNQAGIALANSESEIIRLRANSDENGNHVVLESGGFRVHRTANPSCFIISFGDRWLSGIHGSTADEALQLARVRITEEHER